MKTQPLLICLTSTRNYGWVTSAFLKANSLWADYIIMVDQMSTDGTREMALANSKVILLDNEDLAYSETKRSEMAINRAREIEGDKILIYLAIDEVLPANVKTTQGWDKILKSKQGEVFCFQWANILPDEKRYFLSEQHSWMARGFHDDNVTPYNNEGLDMHTHCIPYPEKPIKESLIIDIKILHFAVFNENWNISKQRFYQLVDFDKNIRTATQLDRMYNRSLINTKSISTLQTQWIHKKEVVGFNLFDEVDRKEQPFFDKYVLDFILKNGINRYRKINVWDASFLNKYNMKDPRTFLIKVVHSYFNNTRNCINFVLVRLIDKFLKTIKF